MSEASIYWKKWFFFLELKSTLLRSTLHVLSIFTEQGGARPTFCGSGQPFCSWDGACVLATFLWDEIDVCHPCFPCVQSLYSDRISVPKVFHWITIGIARYMNLHCAGWLPWQRKWGKTARPLQQERQITNVSNNTNITNNGKSFWWKTLMYQLKFTAG